MIDDDALLSALAALPSRAPSAARAEAIRVHARALVEPASESLTHRAARTAAPFALAAYVVGYLGWTVGRIRDNGPMRVLNTSWSGPFLRFGERTDGGVPPVRLGALEIPDETEET